VPTQHRGLYRELLGMASFEKSIMAKIEDDVFSVKTLTISTFDYWHKYINISN